jgi:hypothetical protein
MVLLFVIGVGWVRDFVVKVALNIMSRLHSNFVGPLLQTISVTLSISTLTHHSLISRVCGLTVRRLAIDNNRQRQNRSVDLGYDKTFGFARAGRCRFDSHHIQQLFLLGVRRRRERVQLILGHAQERGATVNYYVNNSQAAEQSTCILSKPVIFPY